MSRLHCRYLDDKYSRFYKSLPSLFMYVLNTGFQEFFLYVIDLVSTTIKNAGNVFGHLKFFNL